MTITETLSKVEDMLSLIGHQKDNNLKQYFTTANKKTSVATDQINQLIEAVNDRHLRTASNCLDDISSKSIDELTRQMNIRLDYMVDTITSLRRQIIERKDDIKRKMDSKVLLDRLIEQEYVMMRDKYASMLQSSYVQASESMEMKEKLHRKSLERYLRDLEELKSAYHVVEASTSGIVKSVNVAINMTSSVSHVMHKNTISQRPSFVHRRASIPGKTIAQENNELALITIQEKLDALFETMIHRSVDMYDKRIKGYPIQRFQERKRIYTWKKKQIEAMDAEVILLLREQEVRYAELMDALIQHSQHLSSRYDEMYIQMRKLEQERRMMISGSYLDAKFSRNLSIQEKLISTARTYRIGSRIKDLAGLAEMNSSDIKHVLLILASSAKTKIGAT